LAGRFDPAGENRESSVIVIASGSIGSRSSEAGDVADDKRRLFIYVIGGLLLVLGAATAIALLLRRRARQETDSVRAGSPSMRPRSFGQGTVCPTCRQEYPSGRVFCPADGNRLVPVEGPVDPRAATGGICPVCGQGFDPGVVVCPEHGEELLPMALHQVIPQAKIPSGRKICPICGMQYPGDAEFCGADGAHLVLVN
jgi:predicted nucleic acid-binding Zn ribbon protein